VPALGHIERKDPWWIEPLLYVVVLGGFVVYATWAGLQNAGYYVEPYLSPFYSPCISANCSHVTVPLIGSWWNLSPAIFILAFPAGFRLTCYYYRRSYYRAFFWSPPACVVPDARKKYSGETRFPFIFQNIHRYVFYLATAVLAFLWYDAFEAFRFPNGFGIGVGTIILLVNVSMLTLYSASCHVARYLVGGYLDSFHRASLRFRLWSLANRLNLHHGRWAWLSLFTVIIADAYIRLLAAGVIRDFRFL
jgi:hypothetical protein